MFILSQRLEIHDPKRLNLLAMQTVLWYQRGHFPKDMVA